MIFFRAAIPKVTEAPESDEIDRSVVHHRSVMFVKGREEGDIEYWIITDHLTGDSVHTCEQLFHLIPVEVDVDPDTKTVQTVTPDQPNLVFIPAVTDWGRIGCYRRPYRT